MKNRIISVFMAMTMFLAIIPTTVSVGAAASENPNSWTSSDGTLTIGFFNFDSNGVSTNLEIKLTTVPTGFSIGIPWTLNGVTGFNGLRLNNNAFSGFVADASTNQYLTLSGAVMDNLGFESGDTALYGAVNGMGTITFGEGQFVIMYQSGTVDYSEALKGVVLSNETEPEPHNPNNCTLHVCNICNRTCPNLPHICNDPICNRTTTCGAKTCDICGIVRNDFQIENGVLIKYSGDDENVVIPDVVISIGSQSAVLSFAAFVLHRLHMMSFTSFGVKCGSVFALLSKSHTNTSCRTQSLADVPLSTPPVKV